MLPPLSPTPLSPKPSLPTQSIPTPPANLPHAPPRAVQSAGSRIYPACVGQACAAVQSAVPAVTTVPAVASVTTVPAVRTVPAVATVQPAQPAAQAPGSVTDVPKSYQLKWDRVDNWTPPRPYSGPVVGPTFNDINSTPLSIFLKIFDDEVWDFMVKHTNDYARWIRAAEPAKHRGLWEDVTVVEMQCYIGLVIAMGIIKLPRIDYYWQRTYETLFTTGVARVMARNRFYAVSRYIHVCNKINEPARNSPFYDKLYKIRSFSDLLAQKQQSLFNIRPEVTVDEAMVPFKGRIGFKQYMKDKPTKWGIMVWTVSDAKTGYGYRQITYTSKSIDGVQQGSLSNRVVCGLLRGFKATGVQLYTDNFYTNPDLYLHLLDHGIYGCSTIRSNRKAFPKELQKQKLRKKTLIWGPSTSEDPTPFSV